MKVRQLRAEDIPVLNAIAERCGYPYPDLTGDTIETVLVVVDADDQPLMACAAKRLIELYLYVDPAHHPTVAHQCLQLLHSVMPTILREFGYNSVEAFLPPSIAAKFGRRLERSWGWVENWKSWTRRL
jgi:hypothetical protein